MNYREVRVETRIQLGSYCTSGMRNKRKEVVMSSKVFCRRDARIHELGRELQWKSRMVEMQVVELMQ